MGKVFSRFTMVVRRMKVSPEQLVTVEQNGRHHAIERTDNSSLNNTTDIRTSPVSKHLPNEQSPVENDHEKDHSMVSEKSETSQDVTVTRSGGTQFVNFRRENVGNDSDRVCDFCCHGDVVVENAKTDWFDVTESIRTERIYTIVPDIKDESALRTLQGLSCSTKREPNSPVESYVKSQRFHPENNIVFPEDNSQYEKPSFHCESSGNKNGCSSISNNRQHEQELYQATSDETSRGITGDGYSTVGAAGSEEGSFEDREDSNYCGNDASSEMISENFVIGERDDVKLDEKFLEMPAYPERLTPLTSLSLETLNCVELDKRECVRSFIQAWEPTEISHIGREKNIPVTTTNQSPDDKTFDRNVLQFHHSPQHGGDDNDENFFQRSPERVFKTPSNYWVDCRRERVPWSDVALPKGGETTFGRFCDSENDENENISGPRRLSWNDSSNRLTLCSLSTINEESDDEKRREADWCFAQD